MTKSDGLLFALLGSPDVRQERVDFRAQHVGLAAQRAGCGQYLAGGCSGFGRGGADADDIAGNLTGAAGSVLNIAGDLARRRTLLFDRGGDPFRQRQVVTERLAEFAGVLPQGVGAPLLSPLSSSMEYLVHFGYTSDRLSPVELRDVVQWIVKPQILAVPGVAQAQIFGGDSRERQLLIDPLKLQAAGVTLDDVEEAVRRGVDWRVGRSNGCGGIREAEHVGETGAGTPRG